MLRTLRLLALFALSGCFRGHGRSECDCGACIGGRCYDGPGVCTPPAA